MKMFIKQTAIAPHASFFYLFENNDISMIALINSDFLFCVFSDDNFFC